MTLTEASFYTRRFAPFGVIALLVLLIFYVMIQLVFVLNSNRQANQPTIVAFDPKFGAISRPLLPDATPSANKTFVLDTVSGTPEVENATTAAKVIFLPKEPSRFGFLQRIYTMAQEFGFDTEQIKHKIDGTTAVFGDGLRRLTINITNFNFTYRYTLTKEDSALTSSTVPGNEKDLENRAIELLRVIDRYPQELAQGSKQITYLNFNPTTTELSVVQNAESANMVEVNFFRPDIDGYPVVPPTYFNSPHYIVMGFEGNREKIIRAQVNFHEKSQDQVGTYPIKNPDLAWKYLQEGKGYIVSGDVTQSDVKIKKVLFAYLDPEVYQEYMQPVYVFLGDNNFVAYVPALVDNYFTEQK